jgi:prepilin-type processing-associated H-X9-DG protein
MTPDQGSGYAWWRTGAAPYNNSVLAPYVASEEVWFCPAQDGGGGIPKAANGSRDTTRPWPGNGWHGICAQTFYRGYTNNWTSNQLSFFQRPTEMIMFADGTGAGFKNNGLEGANDIYPGAWTTGGGIWCQPNPAASSNWGLTADPPFWPCHPTTPAYPVAASFVARHFGKVDCAFLDGHVGPMDLAVIATTTMSGTGNTNCGTTMWRYLECGNTTGS